MNQNGSSRHHLAESDGATRAIAASRQWHDVELALKVARHSFERWLVADHEDPPSLAIMHAYHTHETLHEAARVITVLIETFRGEAAALIIARHGAPTSPPNAGDQPIAESGRPHRAQVGLASGGIDTRW